MTRCRFAYPGAPVDGLEPHQAHQSSNMFPVDDVVLSLQPCGYLACPIERGNQVLVVNQLHESEILLRNSLGLVVQAGAVDIQQPALAYY